VNVESFISEITYKSNVIRLQIKTWCQSHFCDCSWPNVDDLLCSYHVSTVALEAWFDEGSITSLCRKSFQPRVFIWWVLLSSSNNDSSNNDTSESVCEWIDGL